MQCDGLSGTAAKGDRLERDEVAFLGLGINRLDPTVGETDPAVDC
jgi:hypothetical protein